MKFHRPVYYCHYDDVIMGAMASQITSLEFVYSTVYSGTDQRKHQSSASLAFVGGIHREPGTGDFPTQMASNAENVSSQWHHHVSTDYLAHSKGMHQRFALVASLAFVRGIQRWPVDSPHRGPVTRKMFLIDDVVMHSYRYVTKDHQLTHCRRRDKMDAI